MSSRAQIVLLVGAKGAGKTTIGRVLEREPNVHFLEVELIAKRVLAAMGGVIDEEYARKAFDEIASAVDSISNAHRVIIIETTGASAETPRFIEVLRRAHQVHLVRIHARAESCASRIAARDSSRQVDVPADLIRTMHERTDRLRLAWDLEVHNDPPLTEERILETFEPILRAAAAPPGGAA